MATKINKIPPLAGTPVNQADMIRAHVNRIVDEVEKALTERDREIERLRKEIKDNGRK